MAYLRPYYPQVKVPGSKKRKPSDKQGGWRLNWKDHNGKWRSKVFRGDRKKAEKYLHNLESEVDQINAGLKASPEQRMTFVNAFDMYLKYLGDQRAPSTYKRYKSSLNAFKCTLPRGIQISQMTRQNIESFRARRKGAISDTGIAIDLRHIKAFLNWCVNMGFLLSSPFRSIKISTEYKPVRFLTADEIRALFNSVRDNTKASDLVTFYLETGARATEILPPRFTWANVFQNEITLLGKGEKVRHIGLNDTLKSILESRKHLEQPFPYTYDGVYEMIVRKYYSLAGIQGANLHTLRKTAGALLIQEGVDIYRVSKFLGHNSVQVTERHYIDLLRQDYYDISRILENRVKSDADMMPILETKTD